MTRERILATFVVFAPALAVIAGIALWLNGIGPSETDLIVLAVGSLATMAGVELGYHRYFAHRAFTARPALVWSARRARLERVSRPGDVVGDDASPPSRNH